MAEENEKQEEVEVKKKGPLLPFLFIAVGAALGGGGVVVLTKPPADTSHEEQEGERLQAVHHPDEMEYVFNPVMKRGTRTARIRLKFDYLVKKKLVKRAFEAIRKRWDLATDRCLEVLKQYTAEELQSTQGRHGLKRRLRDELTMVFFPEIPQKDHSRARIAIIENVLFVEFFIQ